MSEVRKQTEKPREDSEFFRPIVLRKFSSNELAVGEIQALDYEFPYRIVSKEGKRLFCDSWHYPIICTCDLVTSKGAYRDEAYEYEGKTIIYYHQHCIMVIEGNKITIDSCRFRTPTTKERINRHLPNGWVLFQKNYEWFLVKRGEFEKPIKFYDTITITVNPKDKCLDKWLEA